MQLDILYGRSVGRNSTIAGKARATRTAFPAAVQPTRKKKAFVNSNLIAIQIKLKATSEPLS